jgi:hypothetical protein
MGSTQIILIYVSVSVGMFDHYPFPNGFPPTDDKKIMIFQVILPLVCLVRETSKALYYLLPVFQEIV